MLIRKESDKTKEIFQRKGILPKDSWKQISLVENLQYNYSMMPRRGKVKTVSMDDINVDYSSILDQAGGVIINRQICTSDMFLKVCSVCCSVFCMLTPVNPLGGQAQEVE